MPKVHFVKKARKDDADLGIKKGESYYWWKFRRGGKRVSYVPPKPSQLTQSEFWQNAHGWAERAEVTPDLDSIEGEIEDIVGEMEDFRDELQGRLDNMPDSLRDGDTGQLLQDRIDALEDAVSNLQSVDTSTDIDDSEDMDEDKLDEAKQQKAEEIWQEVQSALEFSCS